MAQQQVAHNGWKQALETVKLLAHARGMVFVTVPSPALRIIGQVRDRPAGVTVRSRVDTILRGRKPYFHANAFTEKGIRYRAYLNRLYEILDGLKNKHLCTVPIEGEAAVDYGPYIDYEAIGQNNREYFPVDAAYIDYGLMPRFPPASQAQTLFLLFQVTARALPPAAPGALPSIEPLGIITCTAAAPGNYVFVPTKSRDYGAPTAQIPYRAANCTQANASLDAGRTLEINLVCTQQHEIFGGKLPTGSAKLFFFFALCTKILQSRARQYVDRVVLDLVGYLDDANDRVFALEPLIMFLNRLLPPVNAPFRPVGLRYNSAADNVGRFRKVDLAIRTYIADLAGGAGVPPLLAVVQASLSRVLTNSAVLTDLCPTKTGTGVPACA